MSIIRAIKNTMKALQNTNVNLLMLNKALIHKDIEEFKNKLRIDNPKNLIPYGYKMYSQGDEDGIINEIFNRIGETNKIFVEFGSGNGLAGNTLALLFKNWSGLWIDGSLDDINEVKMGFPKTIESGRLMVTHALITKNNINELISSKIKNEEIDLLSVDIDGNDYHIFNEITCIKPRVVVMEYNWHFVPPTLYCMNYNEKYKWQQDDCFGASLKFLEINLAQRGYCLVGCCLVGNNAFFVREDLVEDKFLEPFSAEMHFEPFKVWINKSYYRDGWNKPPSYKTLESSLSAVDND